jgi:transcriptional regulator with XRE-family HTH domain
MTLAQKINMAIAYRGISQAELARLVGTTPSNFNQRLKRASFSLEELEKIAEAVGARYDAAFEFPDGMRI